MVVKYEIDPDGKFRNSVRQAIKQVQDLTVPFQLITKSWYQGNKFVFSLKGPGKYEDYKKDKDGRSKYAEAKSRKFGSAYPMLVYNGVLSGSLTDPGDPNTVATILNGQTLLLGTTVPYGIYHQSDASRTKIPFRPFMFIGGEQTAPDQLNNRREAWLDIIKTFIDQKMARVATPSGAV